jgi:hypothetical protein
MYIGFTSYTPDERYKLHISACNDSRNVERKQHIHSAIIKHGVENFKFDILYQSFDFEHCLSMETHFIREYNSFGGKSGYNHTMGGEDRTRSKATVEKHRAKMKGRKQSTEHCKNKGIALSGKNNGMYGRKLDKKHLNILLEASAIGFAKYREKFTYFYIDVWGNVFETKSKEFLMNLLGVSTWDNVKNTARSKIKSPKGKLYDYRFKNGYKFLGSWKSLLE